MTFTNRLLVTVILQVSIAYLFGIFYRQGAKRAMGGCILFFVVGGVLSAWLSIFNIEYICIGEKVSGVIKNLLLIGLLIIPVFIACLMAFMQIVELTRVREFAALGLTSNDVDDRAYAAMFVQVIAFVLIIISRWFS